MKTYLYLGAIGAGAMMFLGCANDAGNTRTASNSDPSNRTYTGQQLDNTGQAQPGQALQRTDADVSRTR
jgi:hypothetical protein